MVLYYLLFKPVHKLFNSIFNKKDNFELDEKYFFSKKYGFELIFIGFLFGLITLGLYFIQSFGSIIETIYWIFLIMTILIFYRGLAKILAFWSD